MVRYIEENTLFVIVGHCEPYGLLWLFLAELAGENVPVEVWHHISQAFYVHFVRPDHIGHRLRNQRHLAQKLKSKLEIQIFEIGCRALAQKKGVASKKLAAAHHDHARRQFGHKTGKFASLSRAQLKANLALGRMMRHWGKFKP